MTVEGNYQATMKPEGSDYGGRAELELRGGRFELQMVRTYPYSIEDGQTLVGGYSVFDDRVEFVAEELREYTFETVKQERRVLRRMPFSGFFGAADDSLGVRPIAISLRIRGVWPVELRLTPGYSPRV
jgi:hypothetical protein